MSPVPRRRSRKVRLADRWVGGDAPILVQSMTNTDTEDAKSTAEQVAALARAGSEAVRITVNTLEAARQVAELARAGSELVRITVNTPEAAAQVAPIRERLDALGIESRANLGDLRRGLG